MVTVEVTDHGSSLLLTVTDGDRETDLYLAVEHDATFETRNHGVQGFHVDAVTLADDVLYVYATPDTAWTRRTDPALFKRVALHDGVQAGDWTVYDTEHDDVPPPEENGTLVWRRTD